ncbi:hypothetical protein ABE42_33935 [Bacillus thuringiensis]|uniref:hypothetical protein n=1 Tax=Bacillus TaxID=1386 RepID=UPI000F8A095F|nr:hypothetical protein [Bacillus thuringiensis]AZR80579.1 hypothetical protein BtSCAC15_30950 [Bacillus thuringiensis]MBG9584071.1 hypothetical protein [Bacillus thuringiensis]HDR3897089.1 hypothetical protein [Bacillus cereus]
MTQKSKIIAVIVALVAVLGIGSTLVFSNSKDGVKGNGEFIKASHQDVVNIKKNKETKFVYSYGKEVEKREQDRLKLYETRMKNVMKDLGVNVNTYERLVWSYRNDATVMVDVNTDETIEGIALQATKMFQGGNAVKFFYKGNEVGEVKIDQSDTTNKGLQAFQREFESFVKDMKKNYDV